MTDQQVAIYCLESVNKAHILARLEERFYVVPGEIVHENVACFDTCDYRLLQAGCLLKCLKTQYILIDENCKCTCNKKSFLEKVFARDFIDKKFRQRLEEHAGVRALTKICHLDTTISQYSFLNSQQKTVCRMQLVSHEVETAHGTVSLSFLRLEQLKGYENASTKIRTLLDELLTEKKNSEQGLLIDFIKGSLGDAFSKGIAKFQPILPQTIHPQLAVSILGKDLLRIMRKNLHGVLDDTDTEFLHDFRVAARRTRSLLSQLKKYVFFPELETIREELKWLFAITGHLRDLDVYLLKKDTYRTQLPAGLHQGLGKIFASVRVRRRMALKKMCDELTSERFAQLFQVWQEVLDGLAEEMPDVEKNLDCLSVAKKLIRRNHRKIVRMGGAVSKNGPPEKLHEVRIAAKKLRYLLDFFRSFFPAPAIEQYYQQLKKLQTTLGDYNDMHIQLSMLSESLRQLSAQKASGLEVAAAYGGMMTLLHKDMEKVYKQYESAFGGFADESTAVLVEQLLSGHDTSIGKGAENNEDPCCVQ